MIVSGIQPLQNIGLKQSVALSDEKAFTKFSHFWIKKGLSALETITKKSAGDYCVGNTLSMADLCLFPQMYNAKKYVMQCFTSKGIKNTNKWFIICQIQV